MNLNKISKTTKRTKKIKIINDETFKNLQYVGGNFSVYHTLYIVENSLPSLTTQENDAVNLIDQLEIPVEKNKIFLILLQNQILKNLQILI